MLMAVRGLLIPREAFRRFAMNDRARANGSARTASEVAKELHCARDSVFGLVERQLVQGKETPTGLRIFDASVAAFKRKYISLASIARTTPHSAYALMRYCRKTGIPVVLVKSKHREGYQGFVRIQDRDALMALTVRRHNYPIGVS